VRSLEFDSAAFEDLAWWIEQDRNKALRIISLIKDIQRDPFRGIGKPEPLRHELKVAGRVESIMSIDSFMQFKPTK